MVAIQCTDLEPIVRHGMMKVLVNILVYALALLADIACVIYIFAFSRGAKTRGSACRCI
jgi:hypothetical protein